MQIDRILNMILRRFINRGINKGINAAVNRGQNRNDMTPEDRQQAQAGRDNAKRAKQALRVGRRFGRF